jgi:hypothetical protein
MFQHIFLHELNDDLPWNLFKNLCHTDFRDQVLLLLIAQWIFMSLLCVITNIHLLFDQSPLPILHTETIIYIHELN